MEFELGSVLSPAVILAAGAKECPKCALPLYPGQKCPDCYNFVEDTEDFEVMP